MSDLTLGHYRRHRPQLGYKLGYGPGPFPGSPTPSPFPPAPPP